MVTSVKRRREYETPEYAAALERMIVRYGDRVADADEVDLAEMLRVRKAFDRAIVEAVRGQRERHGRSWADIARGLGTTREAAYMRFGAER